MSTNAEQIQELLNGLLDGGLTIEEQRTLDLAMKSDPSLEGKLAEMQAIRRSLLRGRSVGRLSPDFSSRIVSAARKRAEAMGDEAPEWLLSPTLSGAGRAADRRGPRESRVEQSLDSEGITGQVSVASSMSQRTWKVWVPVLAAATAATLVLYIAGPFSSQSKVQPLVGERIPSQASRTGNDGTGLVAEDRDTNTMAVDLLANGGQPKSETTSQETFGDGASKKAEDGNRPSDAIASASNASSDSKVADSKLPEMKANDLPGSDERKVAESREMKSSGEAVSNLASDAVKGGKASDPIRELLDASGVKNPVYTMVVDISIDPIAQQNDALRTLLEEHEIVYADDLNISSENLDSLVASQMVGKMSGVDVAKRSGDVQVLFVRAKAKRIDSFLLEVAGQYKDFPKFRMDMSFDPSVVQLMDQLSTVANKEEGARRLTFRGAGDSGLVSAFPAGKQGEFLDIEKRKRLAGQSGSRKGNSREETSYLILLVRSASSDADKP